MDFVGEAVLHKVFGKGIIVEVINEYLFVQFTKQADLKKFCYPDAFDQYLEAESKNFKKQIEFDKKEIIQRQLGIQQEKHRIQPSETHTLSSKKMDERKNKAMALRNKPDTMNLAIKCTYCDGGASNNSIGYRGVCSDEAITYNIESAKRVWCNQPENLCNQYHQGLITRKALESEYEISKNMFGQSICYESQMMQIWSAGAGYYHTGERAGQPMKLVRSGPDSLALLTTRLPYDSEDKRKIFAVFLVHENYQGDDWEEGHIGADEKFRLELTPEEAGKLKFWDYYYNPNKPEKMVFGSGLHRYLTDQLGGQVMKEICRIKKGTSQEALAEEFLAYYCELKELNMEQIPEPEGPLRMQG